MEVYQQIGRRSPMEWLTRNHYQYVSKHEGLVLSNEPCPPLGPFPYTQSRTYYAREGVVLCRWKLGDDGLDEIVVHDEVMGGKRITNPVLTMGVHRHFKEKRTQLLEEIVEEKYLGFGVYSPLAGLIRDFYKTRSEETLRQVYCSK
jgi:Txe/YoeB family toxin of Txe-Axe toxin-antitoxin module